jgi:hypothetical protein
MQKFFCSPISKTAENIGGTCLEFSMRVVVFPKHLHPLVKLVIVFNVFEQWPAPTTLASYRLYPRDLKVLRIKIQGLRDVMFRGEILRCALTNGHIFWIQVFSRRNLDSCQVERALFGVFVVIAITLALGVIVIIARPVGLSRLLFLRSCKV